MSDFNGKMTNDIRCLLRRKRLERNLTIEELAESLRVTPQTVQRWEDGSSKSCHASLVPPLRSFLESGVLPPPPQKSRATVHFSDQVKEHVSILLLLLKLTQDSPSLRKKLLEGLRQITTMEQPSP